MPPWWPFYLFIYLFLHPQNTALSHLSTFQASAHFSTPQKISHGANDSIISEWHRQISNNSHIKTTYKVILNVANRKMFSLKCCMAACPVMHRVLVLHAAWGWGVSEGVRGEGWIKSMQSNGMGGGGVHDPLHARLPLILRVIFFVTKQHEHHAVSLCLSVFCLILWIVSKTFKVSNQ